MAEQIIKDPTLDVEFDPYVKGHQTYEVDAKASAVRLVQVGNVYPLRDWDFFYVLDGDQYVVAPEMGDIWSKDYPERVYEGSKALKAHVNKCWWGGWMQVAEAPGYGPVTVFITAKTRWMFRNNDVYLGKVTALWDGEKLDVEAQTHAWSYHPNIPGFETGGSPEGHCSIGVGCEPIAIEGDKIQEWIAENIPNQTKEMKDAVDNISLRVSVDPQGGKNPFGEKVIHGPVMHVYNGYVAPLSLQVLLKEGVEPPAPEPPEPEPEPPTPEPEPELPTWDYKTFERGSKIGVHGIWANKIPEFTQQLVDAGTKFGVVKWVNDSGWIEHVLEINPDTTTIGRYTSQWEGCQNVEFVDNDELDNMATRLVDVITDQAAPNILKATKYWEISNEPDPNSETGYYRLGELMVRCMEIAEHRGLKLALLGLNAGTPEWNEMKALVASGMFERAKKGGHILTLHEGELWTNNPKESWPAHIPEAPEIEDAGAMNFRYRYLYHLLEKHDQVIPLVISEWYNGDIDTAGANPPVEVIVDAVAWYDGECAKDYYVWSIQPFTLGAGPTMWNWRNWERFYPGVVEHMIAVKDRQNAEAEKEDEMEKYDRIYRIADPNFMSAEQLDDAYERGRRALNTTGPAWTDAIPPAENRPDEWRTNRIIVAHMPTADRARYREWAQARDPGTELVFEDGEPG